MIRCGRPLLCSRTSPSMTPIMASPLQSRQHFRSSMMTRRSDGWSAEFKIPYRVLRFGERSVYSWGINAYRYISRRGEFTSCSFTPRGVNGWPSRFGHLEGIEGIEPNAASRSSPFRSVARH